MARVLVDIDPVLKRELKVKLMRDGVTLKDWLTASARAYLAAPPRPVTSARVVTAASEPAREAPRQAHPQAGAGERPRFVPPRHDDYLD